MKHGEKLTYTRIREEQLGWLRYRADELFEFSASPTAKLREVTVGSTLTNWTNASLTMSISDSDEFHRRMGTAAPYAANMFFLKDTTGTLDEVVSRYIAEMGTRATISSKWIDGVHGKIPVIFESTEDQYTIDITNFYIYGGCWKFCHQSSGEDPWLFWPDVADRIAASVKFICAESECRKMVYFAESGS